MEVQAYSFNDMIMFADRVCNTDFVPQVYKNKPAEILAAVMYGQEIGLPPMSALKHIVVIKGTPALTSHAMRALVQGMLSLISIMILLVLILMLSMLVKKMLIVIIQKMSMNCL